MSVKVYVAAPFADIIPVRAIHNKLRDRGFEPCSMWAERVEPGTPDAFSVAVARAALAQNDADLASADCVLVIARDYAGGEMFVEFGTAITRGVPVFWVGRRILSAFRPGVSLYDSVDEALVAMESLRRG